MRFKTQKTVLNKGKGKKIFLKMDLFRRNSAVFPSFFFSTFVVVISPFSYYINLCRKEIQKIFFFTGSPYSFYPWIWGKAYITLLCKSGIIYLRCSCFHLQSFSSILGLYRKVKSCQRY